MRPAGFGVHAASLDGQDVRAVYAETIKLVERARKGEGPSFLMCDTYRYRGHHVGDVSREYYRAKTEEQEWVTYRDPIIILMNWLLAQKHAHSAELEKIQSEVRTEIEAAVKFALDAPYPKPEEVTDDVYA
jgi:TPP-dependent pyruvate/acetoin dehydrogenase alpha subunit